MAEQSRIEQIIRAIIAGVPVTVKPQSRIEALLLRLKATIEEGHAVWGNISGTLSNQTDLQNEFNGITDKIPAQASSQNKLADKSFVNSSIATNTAHYIYKTVGGQRVPFDSVAELEAYSGAVTENDYAFVTGTDGAGNAFYDRYKATVSGSTVTWGKEYRLNNSSFTAQQWSIINSDAETWTFTLSDGTTVTKKVVISA